MVNNYYKPTPVIWRKIGDSIMLGCATLSAFIPTSPLSEDVKVWSMFGINVFGVFGKIFTNFFKENESEPNQPTQNTNG